MHSTERKADMAKSRGLGKGLDSLFEDNFSQNESKEGVSTLRISMVEPNPLQPRKDIDSEKLSELADSIGKYGVIQPIVVRPENNGYYQIIAGERRWRAAKVAGLSEIPVVIKEIGDRETAELALVENLMRSDLNPIEEALGYKSLMERFGLSQEKTAEAVGKSRSAVANSLRLLSLCDEVLEFVKEGKLSAGHAKVLAGVKDEKRQKEIANLAIARDLSVRQTEMLSASKPREKKAPTDKVDYIKVLEKRVTKASGRSVKIKQGKKTGRIEITYTDNNDLEDILKKLCGKTFFDDNL